MTVPLGGPAATSHGSDTPRIDWEILRTAAVQAGTAAYAPYSGFAVGAAGLVNDGRIISGCNVENASYGLTLCAECSLVSALVAGGPGRLIAVVCVGPAGALVMPCGRCRQLLWEHGGPTLEVLSPRGPLPMSAVLPHAFDTADLPERGGRR